MGASINHTSALEEPRDLTDRPPWAQFSRPIVAKSSPPAEVEELVRCYTSVPSASARASSISTPR